MEFTDLDREALYEIWMSQKAKMHMTQMEMAKKMGMTQVEFSDLIRGDAPLTMGFVAEFSRLMRIEAAHYLPSLMRNASGAPQVVYLRNRVAVDGEIQHVYIEGNQVIIEYVHALQA
ncbi:XRE family transcriptional regulator [Vibrio sp. T187]|uniref:helix-turn-helix domain-containing protein n=1 Tax=Vibrio TaxID=662 RepID=UPI0010C99B35|nr:MULTISPECIES: helix-turn-helix transcriptional regulator [Vibrio]MBW3694576.1 XRE family transcriptional regulator [Vibrio sp. T187]